MQFPTRIQNNSNTAIDKNFIDLTKLGSYRVQRFYNDLSDHDAKIIKINDIILQYQGNNTYKTRNFNKDSLNDFITRLTYETWRNIYANYDVDVRFNSFLDT
jgi:hypothetical protein